MSRRSNGIVAVATSILALAAVVVLRNSFSPHIDTCVDAEPLRSLAAFDGARDLDVLIYEKKEHPLRVEGYIGNTALSAQPMHVRLLRSYDLARFLQAGLLLLRNFPLPLDRNEVRVVDLDGQAVPIRLRSRETGNSPFVTGYIFAVGNEPVAEPALGALRQLFDAVWSGPKPITILLIEAPRMPVDISEQEQVLIDWLKAAWREVRATCDPRFRS